MLKSKFAYYLASISPKLSFELSYFHNRKKWPNLKQPRDLSEIWIRKVLNGDNLKDYQLADKYLVRFYVSEKGFESSLPKLLGVYDDANNINFDNLPERFAMKMNYGAGMNLIVQDKRNLDIDSARKLLNYWLTCKTNYSNTERHYNKIQRKIIIEEFIDDGVGGFPVDYKFMCINGHVHCILAVCGREKGEGQYLPFTPKWEPLYHYTNGKHKIPDTANLRKPDNLAEMINMAEKLSEGIDLVRIDLYSDQKRIWFGEVTLTPSGCIFHNWSQEAIDEMGREYYKSKIDSANY